MKIAAILSLGLIFLANLKEVRNMKVGIKIKVILAKKVEKEIASIFTPLFRKSNIIISPHTLLSS